MAGPGSSLCLQAGQWGPAVPGPFHQDQAIAANPPSLALPDRKLLAWRGGRGKEPAVDVSDQRKTEEKENLNENMLDRMEEEDAKWE